MLHIENIIENINLFIRRLCVCMYLYNISTFHLTKISTVIPHKMTLELDDYRWP